MITFRLFYHARVIRWVKDHHSVFNINLLMLAFRYQPRLQISNIILFGFGTLQWFCKLRYEELFGKSSYWLARLLSIQQKSRQFCWQIYFIKWPSFCSSGKSSGMTVIPLTRQLHGWGNVALFWPHFKAKSLKGCSSFGSRTCGSGGNPELWSRIAGQATAAPHRDRERTDARPIHRSGPGIRRVQPDVRWHEHQRGQEN